VPPPDAARERPGLSRAQSTQSPEGGVRPAQEMGAPCECWRVINEHSGLLVRAARPGVWVARSWSLWAVWHLLGPHCSVGAACRPSLSWRSALSLSGRGGGDGAQLLLVLRGVVGGARRGLPSPESLCGGAAPTVWACRSKALDRWRRSLATAPPRPAHAAGRPGAGLPTPGLGVGRWLSAGVSSAT